MFPQRRSFRDGQILSGGPFEFGTGGVSYDADTLALLARFTTPATPARTGAIDALIVALKNAGVWSKLDILHVFAGADSQAALRNWKSESFTAMTVNSPTFVADRGYTGDGSSSYLTTGYDPSTSPAGMTMAQDSAHLGAFILTDSASNGFDAGAIGNRMKVRNRSGASGTSGSVSTTSAVSATGAAPPAHALAVRRDGANQILFRNGSQIATTAVASAGLPGAAEILRGNVAHSDRQVAAVHQGAALSDVEIAALYTALLTYMQAVGAA